MRSEPVARRWLLAIALIVGLPLTMMLARGDNPWMLPFGWQMYSIGPSSAEVLCRDVLVTVERDAWMEGACDGP